MANAHNTLIKLKELDKTLNIFPIDMNMGRLKLVWTSKFWKLPAQLASNDFGHSFTPAMSSETFFCYLCKSTIL